MIHFSNRNLVICNNYDEFADKVSKINKDEEDIVGFLPNLCLSLYWINVESVWGVIGFTWDKKDDRGHFNKTTIPFSNIPSLPDGERIKQFYTTFNDISAKSIKIYKSDWSNLVNIYYAWDNKCVVADLTGNNITKIDGLYVKTISVYNDKDSDPMTWGTYLIGDFSKVTYYSCRNAIGNYYKSMLRGICVDDNNKYLNLPAGYASTLIYGGSGEMKLEYYFRDLEDTTSTNENPQYLLYSNTNKYYITLPAKGYIFMTCSNLFWEENDEKETHSANNINYPNYDDCPEITIDAKYQPNVVLSSLVPAKSYLYYRTGYLTKPIKLLNYESVDRILCDTYIKDEWPDVDFSKWTDGENSALLQCAEFADPKLVCNCPYEIDVSDRKYLTVYGAFTQEVLMLTSKYLDCSEYAVETLTIGGRTYKIYDILPTFKNIEQASFTRVYFPDNYVLNGYWLMPNAHIKATTFYANGYCMNEDTLIETSYWIGWKNYSPIIWKNVSKPHIKLVPDSDGKITFGGAFSGYGNFITEDTTTINIFEFETLDETVLKASTINTSASRNGYKTTHPLVMINNVFRDNLNYYNLDVVKLYKCDVTLTHVSSITYKTSDIEKIIDGLIDNDTDTNYSINILKSEYDLLSDDYKQKVLDKNYIWQIQQS